MLLSMCLGVGRAASPGGERANNGKADAMLPFAQHKDWQGALVSDSS